MTTARASLRRAGVFAVLAVALGLVAVRDVSRREAAVAAQIGPVGRVVVLARDVPPGHTLAAGDLAYRRMPSQWMAPRTVIAARQAVGLRTAVALPRGTPLLAAVLRSTRAEARAALASGDRVLELVAVGSTRLIRAGTRVDVVQTAARSDGAPSSGVVADGVEVLDVRDAAEPTSDGAPQVSVTVRVPRGAALRLAAAQDGGGALRLLPRAGGDAEILGATP